MEAERKRRWRRRHSLLQGMKYLPKEIMFTQGSVSGQNERQPILIILRALSFFILSFSYGKYVCMCSVSLSDTEVIVGPNTSSPEN